MASVTKETIKEVYFDNAATTRPLDEILLHQMKWYNDFYANPSSLHSFGVKVETEIKKSAQTIAELLNVSPDELYFTSGGTEANNLALQGISQAYMQNGTHIITSKIEHPSVLETMKLLEQKGFLVTYINVLEDGKIDLAELEKSLTPKTALVSIMHVNNETGVVQDIEKIGELIKSKNKNTIFHTDCVQSFGKHGLHLKKWKVDLCSFSSHKIHGLKGIGGLYIKSGTKIRPLFYGGNQQHKVRPGTENVAGILSFACAAEISFKEMKHNYEKAAALKNKLAAVTESIENTHMNGLMDNCSPYILNLSFLGIKAETLLHALSQEGIYVSTGAACSERQKNGTVLKSFRLKEERIDSALRFSFSKYNTADEVEYCIHVLKNKIAFLKNFTGGRR